MAIQYQTSIYFSLDIPDEACPNAEYSTLLGLKYLHTYNRRISNRIVNEAVSQRSTEGMLRLPNEESESEREAYSVILE